jgi:hypothetical protein
MKKMLFILTVCLLVATSCTNKGQGHEQTQEPESVVVYDADTLLSIVETNIDRHITFTGYVTHTCQHSGKRCFVTGEGQKHSIRVEATGDIVSFDKELIGSKISINGIVRERRLTQTEIADMEVSLNEQIKEDGMSETCAEELANINDMKKWMEAKGKDFYSIYYIDGLSYEKIDN